MIVAQGLPLNKEHINLGRIFSMLLTYFKVRGMRSIPTLHMTA